MKPDFFLSLMNGSVVHDGQERPSTMAPVAETAQMRSLGNEVTVSSMRGNSYIKQMAKYIFLLDALSRTGRIFEFSE